MAGRVATWIQDVATYVGRLFLWVWDELRSRPTVWGSLIVVATTVLVSGCARSTAEDKLRDLGLVLQLLGISTIAIMLRGKGRAFQETGARGSRGGWWARRPRFRPKPQTIGVKGIASAEAFGHGRLEGSLTCAPGASLEDRVIALERNLEMLASRLSRSSQQDRAEIARLTADLETERGLRQSADTRISASLGELAVGGIHVEWLGVALLAIGTVLTTLPADIARLF
jgi:hypothetical protein